MAHRAGLLRTTYSKLERGEALTLSDDDAAALGHALEVEPGKVVDAHAAGRAAYLERRKAADGRDGSAVSGG